MKKDSGEYEAGFQGAQGRQAAASLASAEPGQLLALLSCRQDEGPKWSCQLVHHGGSAHATVHMTPTKCLEPWQRAE